MLVVHSLVSPSCSIFWDTVIHCNPRVDKEKKKKMIECFLSFKMMNTMFRFKTIYVKNWVHFQQAFTVILAVCLHSCRNEKQWREMLRILLFLVYQVFRVLQKTSNILHRVRDSVPPAKSIVYDCDQTGGRTLIGSGKFRLAIDGSE